MHNGMEYEDKLVELLRDLMKIEGDFLLNCVAFSRSVLVRDGAVADVACP